MASIKTKFAVGLFVLVGFFIIVVAFIWLGMSHYLEKGRLYAAYFDQSVQGLAKDSAVKYRGVTIGRVYTLGVAPDGKLIEAILKIEKPMKSEKNVVAELKSVGITGIMFIELDLKREGEPDLSPKLGFVPKYPLMATKPSSIKRAMDNIESLLDQLGDLELKTTVHRLKKTINIIFQAVKRADIENVVQKLNKTLSSISGATENVDLAGLVQQARQTMATLEQSFKDARLKQISSQLRATLKKIDAIAGNPKWEAILASTESLGKSVENVSNNANQFFRRGTDVLGDGGTTLSDLLQVMASTSRQLENVSHNLNSLIEVMADQPSRLLFGEPPPPRPVEKDSTGGTKGSRKN